ncbi:THAP domain-containing protein 6-like [Ruditapes philippinarum]|uniref:THAP domain-containing protein 6-like n=1 Tax=Ruditapes philippinarum TaxID=129788 RepID=UPI00295B50B0|nr:THAP domain-containing protein 6-like [Ruditapes philippinarum]
MPAICCAGGCTNRRGNDISLHNFPRDEKIRAKWVFALRHTGTPYSRDSSWTPHSGRNSQLVCSAHFEKSCFTQQTRTMMSLGISCRPQLEDSAEPTIFASSFGGTGQTDKRRDAYRKREVLAFP